MPPAISSSSRLIFVQTGLLSLFWCRRRSSSTLASCSACARRSRSTPCGPGNCLMHSSYRNGASSVGRRPPHQAGAAGHPVRSASPPRSHRAPVHPAERRPSCPPTPGVGGGGHPRAPGRRASPLSPLELCVWVLRNAPFILRLGFALRGSTGSGRAGRGARRSGMLWPDAPGGDGGLALTAGRNPGNEKRTHLASVRSRSS